MTLPRSARVVIAIQNISFTYDTRMRLIASSLRGAGYDVSVICPRNAEDPRRGVDEGVPVSFFTMPNYARLGFLGHVLEYVHSGIVMSTLLLWRRVRRKLDVAHICLPPHIFFPLIKVLRVTGVRVVVDQHDLWLELFVLRYGSMAFVSRLVEASERAALRSAHEVLVVNDSGARVAELRAGVPKSRVTMVRTGIRELPPVVPWRSGSARTVGYVGNMEPQDGVDHLIEAARIVHQTDGRAGIRFLCIGDGSDLPRLRSLASHYLLGDVIEFAGRHPHREVLRRLGKCDICVQPDPRNPFNESCTMLKSLEYMALGRPIVALSLDETSRACGDAAVYASTDAPAALAKSILDLVDDPERRERVGRLGRRRVEAMHIWGDDGEAALLAAYGKVIHPHSNASRTEPSNPSGTTRPAA